MKLNEAIEMSPAKVAIMHRKIGTAYQIITCNLTLNEYNFENIIFKNGKFAESGGVWEKDAPKRSLKWLPLNIT